MNVKETLEFAGAEILQDAVDDLFMDNCRLIRTNNKMREALQRIDLNYRESSNLPLEAQAYCMRSEAKVGLESESAENWNKELNELQEQFPNAQIKLLTV